MKTVVISAVNIRKGGTLTILKQCLEYLSSVTKEHQWRVIAIVHRKDLCLYSGIEYIEMPHVAKGWLRRLWCEYITMNRLSKQLGHIDLWFSLHDTTPRVKAARQAVYCQTSFPFLKWKIQDLRFDPKIVLFALLTRFAYRINIHKNRYLIVQAEWLRQGFANMFGIAANKFIVAPPQKPNITIEPQQTQAKPYTFIFPSTPDCHKNFELACEAAKRLEQEVGKGLFNLIITIQGHENRYAEWLHQKWGNVESIRFVGFLTKEQLFNTYAQSNCLVYPSRVETWGLAISEFGAFDKPMILADLPYAHETSAGCSMVSYFEPDDAEALKHQMRQVMEGNLEGFAPNPGKAIEPPVTHNWEELFALLLK